MTRVLTDDDKVALRAYGAFFRPHHGRLREIVDRHVRELHGLDLAAWDEATRMRLEERAITEDDWEPFFEHQRARGAAFAAADVPYAAWFALAGLRREIFFALLHEHRAELGGQFGALALATHLALELGGRAAGAAFFEAKETRTREQDRQVRDELQRTEAQLQHAQKMDAIGRLAGGVAHDFNNMLTVVSSYACMLEESLDHDDPRRGDATEIRLAGERATKLTRQLLTLSKKGVATARPVRLAELVTGFRSTLARLLGPGIALEIAAGDVPSVTIDAGQFEQVIMNLAVNARDAMQGAGRVTIETSTADLEGEAAAIHGVAAGRYVVVAVTDSGPGIEPEIQQRLFEPFFTTKDAAQGTGLGLSIAHGIVTQAGGAIDVYSERGHGATFRIRLPVSTGEVVAAVEEVVAIPRKLAPVTVLFVDPQADVRALATRVLQPAGCTVLEASSGAEARAICLEHDGALDVVVIDVALPDGRGDLFVRHLRELRQGLRVVVMSGYPASTLGPSGEGEIELLAKPFTPAQLRDAIAAATAGDARARQSEPSLQSRILVVDDDSTLRRMLVRLLRRASYDVVDVGSGREGLAALGAQRFDVVLSDIHMPDGDGLDLLRAVRRIDLDIPVILMSGKPDVATAATALEFGAFRYLTKPLETEAVERIVRHAARAHALARIRRQALSVARGQEVGAADRAGLEVRFDQALEHLWMAYQPIVDARTEVLFGLEALMRSREPSLPTPFAMLDAAGQLERMPVLGRRTRSLAATAIAARPDVPSLFINLHPTDLFDAHLLDASSPLVQMATRVVLEVTERESLATGAALTDRLARLRELGYRIAVDDIGAGYSGLTSFTDLMPEIVKIDMSLVRSIHASKVKQRTVGALCTLCHEMGTLVVGEGVETVEERECLVALGCDLLQGYLIARPAPLADRVEQGIEAAV